MKTEQLEKFKQELLQRRAKIINSGIFKSMDDLKINSEDLPDEGDIATNVVNQQVTFDIRRREMEKLKAIDMALHKITQGTFGVCEECEEPISTNRLQKHPWASLCITHAEEYERERNRFYKSGS